MVNGTTGYDLEISKLKLICSTYFCLTPMEQIADALDIPLPALLEETDMDRQSLEALTGGQLRGIAEGYERVSLLLPTHQAFIAKQWAKETKEHLKKK
jgi:hypothetical protein